MIFISAACSMCNKDLLGFFVNIFTGSVQEYTNIQNSIMKLYVLISQLSTNLEPWTTLLHRHQIPSLLYYFEANLRQLSIRFLILT